MPESALKVSVAASVVFLMLMIFLRYQQETKMMAEMNQRTKEVNWLSMLINLISHNVRAPIASVQSNLDLIEMKSTPNELEIQGEIDRMRTGIEDATSIMDRFLRAASLASTVKVERNGRVLERFKQSYPEVVFEGEMDPLIVDSQQIGLQLALEVFIDNAIGHGGGEIKVSFSMNEVIIYDNGSGLTEAELSDFGSEATNNLSQRKVHGVGVHFALRMLESIQWKAMPENLNPGFRIVLSKLK